MIRRRVYLRALVMIGSLILFSQCDFPPDPPLKTDQPTTPPVVVPIDSARWLLPLKAGNTWSYIVTYDVGQVVPLTTATCAQLMFQGEVWYELRYSYYKGSPAETVYGFPPLLQQTSQGLYFYDRGVVQDTVLLSRSPKLRFVLPYPAQVGSLTRDPRADCSVLVVAKDTTVKVINTSQAFRCYRYDVIQSNEVRYTILAVPGSALLKITQDKFNYHTVSWRVD